MNTNIHNQELNSIYQSLSVLNINELDLVMNEIITIRRQKMPSVLLEHETELLRKINMTPPSVIQKRYNQLIKKKTKDSLKEEELHELIELTTYMENFNTKRLEYLLELSKLKNITLDMLMEHLQIKAQLYVA